MPAFQPAALRDWTETVLTAAGASDEIARIVARSLVSADLRGHGSHGVRLLPMYVERIGGDGHNRIDPTARPTVERRAGPRVLVDGSDAFGRVVGQHVTDLAIDQADESGLAVVGVRDGNHLGRMGEWAEVAAEAGLVTVTFVKGEAAFVAPPGSTDRRLSTNPIAVGIPTFDALDFPIVLDMATSVVAGGKTWERKRAGEDLPEGWVVTDDGEPATTPDALEGGTSALLPLGGTTAGHKGFGLAVIAELLGALLGNGVVAGDREHVHFNNAVGLLAIDPTWFTSRGAIETRLRTFTEYLRDTTLVPGLAPLITDNRVMLPGEPEHRHDLSSRQSGVDIPDETVTDLNGCADAVDRPPLRSDG
jgi:uncharacterized oxidoreductase